MRRELSPSTIISVGYKHRRYFNWFVVVQNGRGVPDGCDADDTGPSPPPAKKKQLSGNTASRDLRRRLADSQGKFSTFTRYELVLHGPL